MSRALAGVGGVVGAAVGTFAGIVLSEYIPPQPGYTPADDEALTNGAIVAVAAVGAFIGTFIGAGPDQPSKQIGTSDLREPGFP